MAGHRMMLSIPVVPKNCAHCGQPLERKRFKGGILEDRGIYARRLYCNRSCMGMAFLHEQPTRWAVQKRVRKFLKPQCEHCGTAESLSIHHKDRNWRNNDPGNLQTLCMSCHTALHHLQGDIMPKKIPPPCSACGKPSYRLGLCSTHLTRFKKHGSPYLIKKQFGSVRLLVEDRG